MTLNLLIFSLAVGWSFCQQLQVTPINSSINANTTYTVTVDRTSATANWSASAYIIIDFPSYTSSQLSTVVCTPNCTVNGTSVNISVNSTSFPSSSKLSIIVTRLLNPSTTKSTDPCRYNLFTANGTLLEASQFSLGSFLAGTFKQCKLSFSNNVLRTNSTASLLLEPQNSIPANGSLVWTVPTQWSNTIIAGERILSQGLTCTSNATGADQPTACSVDVLNTAVTIQLPVQYSSVLLIKLMSVLTPPTSLQQKTVSIASYSNTFDVIDNFTTCTIDVPQPTALTLSLSAANAFVSKSFSPIITFNSTDLINVSDTLQLNVSSLMQVLLSNTLTIVATQSGLNYTSTADLNTTLSNVSNGRLVYSLKKLSSRAILPVGSAIVVTGLQLQAPATTQPVQPYLVMGIARNTAYFSFGSSNFTARANSPINISITSVNSTIAANTSYTVNFTISSALTTQCMITVKIPTELNPYSLQQTCSNFTVNSSIRAGVNCTVSNGLLVVYPGVSLLVNTTITLSFNGTNPSSQKPTSAFQINTFSDGGMYSTDYNNTLVYTAAASNITQLTLTRINHTVGAATAYTFIYTTQTALVDSQLNIQLCPEVAFSSSTQLLINGTSVNSTVSARSITASLGSRIKNTTVNITIAGVLNPNSTKGTSSFVVEVSTGGYRVEALTSGLQLTNGTMAAFAKPPTVVPSSKMNGQWNSYQLTIYPSVSYLNGTRLQLTLPSQIALPTNLSCSGGAGFSSVGSIKCSRLNSTSIELILLEPIANPNAYVLNVGQFKNARNYTKTLAFTLVSMTSDGMGLIDQTIIDGIANSLPNYLLALNWTLVSPEQFYRSSIQTIKFTFQLYNSLIVNDYLQLAFPSQYTFVDSTSICSDTSISCVPKFSRNLTLSVRNISIGSTVSLTVSGYQSPLANSSSYFNITTFDSNNNPIDTIDITNSLTQLQFKPTCQSGCMTCQTTNHSKCTSCYPSTLDNRTLLNTYTQSCVDVCQIGYYAKDVVCIRCTEGCTSCNAFECLVCSAGYNRYNMGCITACPQNTYSLSSICVQCSSACLNCSTTQTNCTSCKVGQAISINNTTGSCVICSSTTSPFYNVDTRECAACQPPCQKCNGSICLECYSSYNRTSYLLEEGNCRTECSTGLIIYKTECVKDCPQFYSPVGSECLYNNAPTIPIPFSLAGVISILVVAVSKFRYPETSLLGFECALLSILQTLSTIAVLISSLFNILVERYSWGLVAAGLALQLIINIASLIVFHGVKKDSSFSRWRHTQMPPQCSCMGFWLHFLSMFNSNFLELIFCKGFGARILSAPLSDSSKFKGLTITSSISMAPTLLVLVGSITIIIRTRPAQLLMLCIDNLFLSAILIALVALNLRKDPNYFQEGSQYRNEVRSEVNLHIQTNQTHQDLDGGVVGERQWGRAGCKPTYRNQQSQQVLEEGEGAEFEVVLDNGEQATANEKVEPASKEKKIDPLGHNDIIFITQDQEEIEHPIKSSGPLSLNSPSKTKRRPMALTVDERDLPNQLEQVEIPSTIQLNEDSQYKKSMSIVDKLEDGSDQDNNQQPQQEEDNDNIEKQEENAESERPQQVVAVSLDKPESEEQFSDINSGHSSLIEDQPSGNAVLEESNTNQQRNESILDEQEQTHTKLHHQSPTNNFSKAVNVKSLSERQEEEDKSAISRSNLSAKHQQLHGEGKPDQGRSLLHQNQLVQKPSKSESLLDQDSQKESLPVHSSIPLAPSQLLIFDVDQQLERASQVGKIVKNQVDQSQLHLKKSELVSSLADDSNEVPEKPALSFFKIEPETNASSHPLPINILEWYEDYLVPLEEKPQYRTGSAAQQKLKQTAFSRNDNPAPEKPRVPRQAISKAEEEQEDIFTYLDYEGFLAGETSQMKRNESPSRNTFLSNRYEAKIPPSPQGQNILSDKAQRLRAIYLNRSENKSRAKSRSRSRI